MLQGMDGVFNRDGLIINAAVLPFRAVNAAHRGEIAGFDFMLNMAIYRVFYRLFGG
jgi:hypothetical protein